MLGRSARYEMTFIYEDMKRMRKEWLSSYTRLT